MSWRISWRNFALVVDEFLHTALSGGKRAATWKSVTKSVVTICRSPQSNAGAAFCIDVLVARESFLASGEFVVLWRVWLVAALILAADSIPGFGCVLSIRVSSDSRGCADPAYFDA